MCAEFLFAIGGLVNVGHDVDISFGGDSPALTREVAIIVFANKLNYGLGYLPFFCHA